jgi:hypothetical protein
VQRLRRFDRGGKLGERHAVTDRFRNVIGSCVVVTRQGYVAGAGERDELAMIRLCVRGLVGNALGKQHIELGVAHAGVLAAVIVSQLLLVAELPLSGGVVHQ